MEGVLPTSLECLDLETGIQWSSLTGSSAIRCLLKECAHQCFHGNKLLAEQQAEEILDVTWEKLNTGHWKDVKVAWRHVFSYASLLKVLCIYSRNPLTPKDLQEALTACDRGLLMGAPIMNGILTQLASCLHRGGGVSMDADTKSSDDQGGIEYGDGGDDTDLQGQKRKRMKLDDHPAPIINEEHQIPRLVTPSLQAFLVDNMKKESPVIIEEAMDHWPARNHRCWSLSYLRRIAGKRTVPVELGSKYTDDSWSQSLMTLADFIDHHIDIQKDPGSSTKVGYLAQHQLFDQIPELKADICIPDYCCLHLPDSSLNVPAKMENQSENDGGRKTPRGEKDENKCHRVDDKEDAKQMEEKQDGDGGKDGKIDGTKKHRDEKRMDTDDGGGMEQGEERKNEQGIKMTDQQERNQVGDGGKDGLIDGTEKQRYENKFDKADDNSIDRGEERRNERGNDGEKEQGVEMMVATQARDDDEEEEEEGEEDIDINAWFGPAGTVSPLHFDPKHNLLCQVVGKKYIRLYSKDSTHLLYKHQGLLSNTSQVDVENVDVAAFPLFQQAPYQECILSEGEMLYIPPGCWHYIRSLSLSFSVSFWWR